MKTRFSSVLIPLPANKVAKRFRGCLFATLKKGEGEATFLEEGEKVGMFTCLNNFCA